ncbi:hypothetical protein [Caldivirga sp.]|uniref:hypothetical protein n=1 Tax=Caldivirga sp. TaxID=2080243 RepID=UPI003D0CE01D
MSSRLGLGEIYVFAVFIIAAAVFLVSILYLVNSIRGFMNREVTYAAEASASKITMIPQVPPTAKGYYTYVNASLKGDLSVYSAGNPLPNYAFCLVKLSNGTEYYAQGTVLYYSTSGLSINVKCPIPLSNLSNVAELTLTIPTPLGSSVELTYNYMPYVQVETKPQLNGTVVGLYVVNNSTGWVYINATATALNGYVVKLGSAMIPPESALLLTNSTSLINSPIAIIKYTVNNLVTVSKLVTTVNMPLPSSCLPSNVIFNYLGNGTLNSWQSAYDGSSLYWNYMVYHGTVNELMNPIYMYATTLNSSGILILYYDLSKLQIGVDHYPMVSAILYPSQFSVNGTVFFIFIVTDNNELVVIYMSSNVNPSSTVSGSNSISDIDILLKRILKINVNNVVNISNGTIFSNTPLYFTVNLKGMVSGNYKYFGVGLFINSTIISNSTTTGRAGNKGKGSNTIVISSMAIPSYGVAYWDYLCIGK